MRTQRQWTVALYCACALLANGLGVFAQGTRQEKPQPKSDGEVVVDQEINGGVVRQRIVRSGVPGPVAEIPFPPEIVLSRGDDNFTFNFVASEMSFEGKVVKGAPYSAEAVTETTQTLGDGNRIYRKTTASVYRDSEGRTRRDQTVGAIGAWAAAGDPPQTFFINDPVAGVNYILDPRSHTARKMTFHFAFNLGKGLGDMKVFELAKPDGMLPGAPFRLNNLPAMPIKKVDMVYPPAAKAAGVQGPVTVKFVINEAGEVESAQAVDGHPLLQQAAVDAVKQWRFPPVTGAGKAIKRTGVITYNFKLDGQEKENSASPNEQAAAPARHGWVKESLGKQIIEGVEAEGTRSTMTIPANAIGNERPIQVVSEKWYSPELQTVVMSKHSDPRSGETVYRLTNINRSEPAPSLFEIPSDYKVKEGLMTPGVRVMKYNKLTNDK